MKHLPKIDYPTLVGFASQDATRPDMQRPWTAVRDGQRHLYATDGRILVEAHPDDLEGAPAGELWPSESGRSFDPAVAVRRLGDRLAAVLLDRRPVAIDDPDLPEIETISENCAWCAGVGHVACGCPGCRSGDHDCLRCGGAGRFVRHEPAALPIHGQWIASLLLERLRPLPRLLFLDAADGHLGLPFVWGERSKGMVMPLRETAEATAHTLRVARAIKEGRAA